jgi:putative tricarboxylic transport membrane protein
MTDLLANLALGFSVAAHPANIGFCLLGALVGTLVGVLPGIGTVATVAMLLPITFGLPPVGALIMLAGIYYGAQYGGSTTSILVNIPGEATSVVTCLDGHQMARQGRAGAALSISAIGSFFAGCISTVLVAALGAPLTSLALLFGPAEYFSLMLLGLIFAVVLARGSVLKSVAMVLTGLLLSMVGSDLETGAGRMTFDIAELSDGIGFTNVAMGLFGFAEIIRNLEMSAESREIVNAKISGLMPTRQDLVDSSGAIARGTILGSILGILPGGGAVVASFAAYTFEKRISKHPERFGRGAIQGVAAPEAANNAAAQTSFIPLLTLGIPPNAVMALMVGAMTIHGIVPGPQVMTKQPELFWGMIASMWLGNLMLVIINLPLVGVWVSLLRVPYRLLYPSIIVFCCIGIYSINNSPTDVVIAAIFGLFGYWLVKHDFEPAPLVLAFVLGPLMEENLRRAMLIARGDVTVFATRPISAGLILVALFLLVLAALKCSSSRKTSHTPTTPTTKKTRPAHRRPCCIGADASARQRHNSCRQQDKLDAEDGHIDVPGLRHQWHRRWKRLIAVRVIGFAAVDRHGQSRHEKRGIDDHGHQRDQRQPLDSERARPPDQRQRQQAEADIAVDLPDHMKARMAGPLRVGGVGLVEIGEHRAEGIAGGRQGQ